MHYCLDCETAYNDELEACPNCGSTFFTDEPVSQMEPAKVEKGKRTKRDPGPPWPLDGDGEPVEPALLERVVSANPLDAEMRLALLKASGIPATSRYPDGGSLGQIVLGFSGVGEDIYVPETMLEEARAVIHSALESEEEDHD